MADSLKEFYTTKELAELLDICLRTVFRLMEREEIPYYEIGRVKRFRKSDVEEYLAGARRVGIKKRKNSGTKKS